MISKPNTEAPSLKETALKTSKDSVYQTHSTMDDSELNALSENNNQLIEKYSLDPAWQAATSKKYHLVSLLGKGTFG